MSILRDNRRTVPQVVDVSTKKYNKKEIPMKKIEKKTLWFGFLLLFLGLSLAAQTEAVKPTLADVDAIMAVKTVENCKKAIEGYKLLLKDDPNNYEILYKLADAHTYLLDIKTDGFLEEKDEYKPLLKEYGSPANDYADKAYKLKPQSKEVVASALRAYAYHSSSFGIVKAIFKGAAGHFKDLANQLIKLDDKFIGAMGYRFMGKFYFMAPWPVGSDGKALSYFKKGIAASKETLYSHYYAGVLYFEDDEYELAKKEFTFVRDNPPTADEEYYFATYKQKANEYLAKIDKKKKK